MLTVSRYLSYPLYLRFCKASNSVALQLTGEATYVRPPVKKNQKTCGFDLTSEHPSGRIDVLNKQLKIGPRRS